MSTAALSSRSFSHAVKTFHPNWFGSAMGTGMVGVMLGEFATEVPALEAIGIALWGIDTALFLFFAAMLAGRLLCFPATRRELLDDPIQSVFIGAIPICLATIVNGCILFGPHLFGPGANEAAFVGWCIDAAMAAVCSVFIPYQMFSRQALSLDRMSPLWLLPVVPCEAAAASAGWLAPSLDQGAQQILVVGGTILWGLSVPIALAILCVFGLRLALHKLPPKELGASGWLTVGPLGAGAFGILLLGSDVAGASAGTPLAGLGDAAWAIGIFAGLVLWGYGVWWSAISAMSTLHHVKRDFPFNLGWWALVFPVGVYAAATLELGETLHAAIFTVLAACLTLLLAVVWCIVAARTVASMR